MTLQDFSGPTISQPLLAVDDEPAIRRLVQLSLSYSGYTVETANSAAAARAMIQRQAYAMVISDLTMPGGSGLELLQFVRRIAPDTPFVLLTGTSDTATARQAIATGATDFVTKPFRPQDLVRVVEQNWQRAIVKREQQAAFTNEVLTDTIRALVAAVDAKDPYTACHSEAVAALAGRLGRLLDLDPPTLRILQFAALLHDVGKIAVPTAILRKPGALNREEWAVIRKHPEVSAEIVSKVGALYNVATLVRHHHEWLDGSGYPDGLQGEVIPWLTRIISVADAFEAMTSARAYRPAVETATAMELIVQAKGKQFDHQVVEALLQVEDLETFRDQIS